MTTLHSAPASGTHPTSGANPGRGETRDLLGRATYDLLVIGGGILGITTAWHAAQSGLRVAMVDAGDFAGATSSASSKLLHGGLRYLQTGAVKLVAENHLERRAVSRDVAPHLAKPLTFYLPVYKGGPHGADVRHRLSPRAARGGAPAAAPGRRSARRARGRAGARCCAGP